MIYELVQFDAGILFAGFGLGFFLGNLVSLIKFIFVGVIRWFRP